ncbi:glycoside hydrolase family 26 protein [Halococcus agarilyticus]|uniref:glycoside hydrolase family 26 protein n=1 Tax=Halococcus agarilyticus TaxID=1232219 RepID=UPI00226BA023|nr:glycosyl hydrolase [Halococcus agarilyticus]
MAGLTGVVGASGCASPLDSLLGGGGDGSSGADGSGGTDGSNGASGSSGGGGGSGGTGESTATTGTNETAETPTATPEAPPTRSGAALAGVYPGGPEFVSNLAPYTEWLDQSPAVVLLYVDAFGPSENKRWFVENPLTNVWEAGHVPMISWQPFGPQRDRTSETIEREIATGEYDDQLAEWALLLESWARPRGDRTRGRRFYIRPAHEMNGNWFPWSPVDASRIEATVTPVPGGPENANETLAGASRAAGTPENYIVMWRRLYDMFGQTSLDETDMQWVWAVNANQVPDNNRTERFYPGDEYVDWVAIDGFNFGATQSYSSWRTPEELFDPMLGRLRELTDKPVALTEFASSSFVETTNGGTEGDGESANGGEYRPARKAAWIEAAFEYVRENDIKMTCWFNIDKSGPDEADWAVFGGERGTSEVTVSGEETLAYEAYKRTVTDEAFLGARTDYPPLLTDAEFAGEF